MRAAEWRGHRGDDAAQRGADGDSRARQYQIRGHLTERLKNEQALRAADRRKDEFLATLGHELRNPLAPIMNSLEIMKLSGAFDDTRTLQACAVMDGFTSTWLSKQHSGRTCRR